MPKREAIQRVVSYRWDLMESRRQYSGQYKRHSNHIRLLVFLYFPAVPYRKNHRPVLLMPLGIVKILLLMRIFFSFNLSKCTSINFYYLISTYCGFCDRRCRNYY